MQCVHHWAIENASGPVSRGTCKMCGEVREFLNSADTSGKTWRIRIEPEKQGPKRPI